MLVAPQRACAARAIQTRDAERSFEMTIPHVFKLALNLTGVQQLTTADT